MQVTGIVVRVLAMKVSGANDFKSRAVHIKTNEQYPQVLSIDFNQGNVTLLDNLLAGTTVKIDINLKGREWSNPEGLVSVFNTLIGWKIERIN